MRSFILGILIVAGTIACQKSDNNRNDHSSSANKRTATLPNQAATYTGSITWTSIAEANTLIQSYQNGLDSLSDTLIKYMMIDAAALRTYLEDSSITQFKLILAHSSSTYATAPNSYQGLKANSLTAIMVGVNLAGDYVYYDTDLAINRITPCPHNCPLTGTAANDLLTITP